MPEDIPGGDMSSCMRIMQDDGHNEDAAARICQALREEQKHENGDVAELRASIEQGRGLISDVSVDLNSAVDVPAIDSQWVAMKSNDSEYNIRTNAEHVFKADDSDNEKRISYAPAMIPRQLDKEGDVVSTPKVEQAAHDYLINSGGIDTDHNLIDGKGEVVESWIEPTEREWELPNGEMKTYPAGTWMLGIKWQPEPWKRIKNEELAGLSIYGMSEKVPLGKEFTVPFADEAVVHVVYESESAARKAAEELGLVDDDGVGEIHPHDLDGMDVFMPGEEHDDFVTAYMDEATSESSATETEAAGDETTKNGETDNGSETNQTKQDNTMTNTTDGDENPTVDAEAFKALQSQVEELKDAVTDKQPGDASNGLDDLVSQIKDMDGVEMEDSDIRDHLKDLFSTAEEGKEETQTAEGEKADHGDDDDEEDYENKETEKSASGEPNFSKSATTQTTAGTAKNADGAINGVPDYGDAVRDFEQGVSQ